MKQMMKRHLGKILFTIGLGAMAIARLVVPVPTNAKTLVTIFIFIMGIVAICSFCEAAKEAEVEERNTDVLE